MKRWTGWQNKTEMTWYFKCSIRDYCVSEARNSHFSVVPVTWTSPNYRFTMLHFEQRSALKCCISEEERERCQFSTDVKGHCFIGPKCSSATLQLFRGNMLTPVSTYSLHAQNHSSQPVVKEKPLTPCTLEASLLSAGFFKIQNLQSRERPQDALWLTLETSCFAEVLKKGFARLLTHIDLKRWRAVTAAPHRLCHTFIDKHQSLGFHTTCWLETEQSNIIDSCDHCHLIWPGRVLLY